MRKFYFIYNRIFFYSVAICIVIAVFVSFYRFVLINDYVIYYEGSCDPVIESCFESCDGECYYYTKVQKYAPDIYYECGKDITDCEVANVCLLQDRRCSVVYCNQEIDEDCDNIINENILYNDSI